MPDLRSALALAIQDELDAALGRITHCLDQLTDGQVWGRSRDDMNSIANLILHLTGNVRQMITHNLTAAPDDRDRPAEFAARDPIPKAELRRRLADAVGGAKAAVAGASEAALCGVRRVNNNDWTGLQALVRSVAHFRGHTQEIIHMTRTILGDAYQFAGPR